MPHFSTSGIRPGAACVPPQCKSSSKSSLVTGGCHFGQDGAQKSLTSFACGVFSLKAPTNNNPSDLLSSEEWKL